MRRRRTCPGLISGFLVALGIIIILAMVLPAGVWWFLLGIGLIALGVCWCRKW